jgi:hypothetical protein
MAKAKQPAERPGTAVANLFTICGELKEWFGTVVAEPDTTPGGTPGTHVVRAGNDECSVRVYVYADGAVNVFAEVPGSFTAAVPTVGHLRAFVAANFTEVADAGRNVWLRGGRQPLSRGARRAVTQLVRFAEPGSTVVAEHSVSMAHGGMSERVRATIGTSTVEVGFADGQLGNTYVRPLGAVDRPQEDYYPGTWAKSLAGGIALALPERRGIVRNPSGIEGWLTVAIGREGAGLDEYARVILQLEGAVAVRVIRGKKVASNEMVVRKIAAGTDLFALCEAVVAGRAVGDDLPGHVLTDWFEERDGEAGDYVRAARAWPQEVERRRQATRERNAECKQRLRDAQAARQ